MEIIYYIYGGSSNIKIWLLASSAGHPLSYRCCSLRAAMENGLLTPCYWLCQDNKPEGYGYMKRQTERLIKDFFL